MKKKLLSFVFLTGAFIGGNCLKAQEYQPLIIQSGFNEDVIANSVGSALSSTSTDIDNTGFAFVSRDYKATESSTALTYGLPTNRIINSVVATTVGLSYELGSYSTNNSLKLSNDNPSGTIIFTNQLPSKTLYMLATTGSGSTVVNVDVNFTDNTSQTFSSITISDWYGGNNYAIQGLGRINRNNNNLDPNSTNPRLYQIPLTISTENNHKLVKSVTITKTSTTGGLPNIFAFTTDVYNACTPPTNITANTSINNATISWTAPSVAPSSGYQYYLSTSTEKPSTNTTPTGNITSGTSLTLNNLIIGQKYYFWLRSNCDNDSYAFWKPKEFKTGEITTTYTLGDINTEYTNTPLNTSSTSNCPGNLSIVVPEGYQIKSTDVSYTMSATNNGRKSDQRSLLTCLTNNTTETAISSGIGSSGGSYNYNRSDLTLANGLTGTVQFSLNAWRTYGDTDCNATYNKVDNSTFKITITLEPITLATSQISVNKNIAYPNPFTDILYLENSESIKKVVITDFSGKVVKNINNPASSISLIDLKSGVYLLTLTMNDNSVKSIKTIKK